MDTDRIPALDDTNDDDLEEIRFSLTALGEAALNDQRSRFFGFGPCCAVA